MKKLRFGVVLLAGLASYCLADQPLGLSGSQAEPLQGHLLARVSEEDPWRTVKPGQVDQGAWLRTESGCEAVVALRNQCHLRMAENTCLHVSQSDAGGARLQILEGKVLSDVPEHGRSTLALDTPEGVIHSSAGVTVVEVAEENTKVTSLTGSASVQADQLSLEGEGELPGRRQAIVQPGLDMLLALDGPDTRRRNQRRKPFVQGEETQPKRLGEDETPSPSPSPSVTPTPPPTVVQPPPVKTTPVVASGGGGGDIWPYFLGAAGLGTGAYFLFRDDDDDEFNNGFFVNPTIPASP